MAHEVETAMFVGQPAWHGLGLVLESAPTIEEAIVAAGLDWKVKLLDLVTKEEEGREVEARATVRESDNSILGVVGPKFVPLQNADAFRFFQPFIDDGSAKLEAAGSLRNGKRVWVLASIKQAAEVVEGDEIRNYVLLAHGHDGSLAIRVGFTMVRVVCANTLSASLDDESSKLIKINHMKHAGESLKMVQSAMSLASKSFEANVETLRHLAKVSCSNDLLKRYTREVFSPGEAFDVEGSKRIVAAVSRLFESGRGTDIPGVKGTMWGAFNALTEYLTHERGKTADARVESAWFGDSARMSERALMLAIEAASGRFSEIT